MEAIITRGRCNRHSRDDSDFGRTNSTCPYIQRAAHNYCKYNIPKNRNTE